ncbi:unnamed protein product [Penicillium glandicola]
MGMFILVLIMQAGAPTAPRPRRGPRSDQAKKAAKKALRKEEEAAASNGEGPAPAAPEDLQKEAEAAASGEKGKSFLIQNLGSAAIIPEQPLMSVNINQALPPPPDASKPPAPAAGSSPAPAAQETCPPAARSLLSCPGEQNIKIMLKKKEKTLGS